MEYVQTWKERATPSGSVYWAHTARAPRTSGKGSTGGRKGWPTPVANDDNKSVEAHLAMKKRMGGGRKEITSLQVAVQTAGWPTPMSGTPAQHGNNPAGNSDFSRKVESVAAGWPTPRSGESKGGEYKDPEKAIARFMNPERNNDLNDACHLAAGWTTPQAHDASPRGKGQKAKHGTRHGCADLNADAQAAGWATPRAEDSESSGMRHARGVADTLTAQSAGWATPSSRDWKDTPGMATEGTNPDGSARTRIDQLPRQAARTGTGPSGTPAGTGKSGGSLKLAPEFSLWLMMGPIWCRKWHDAGLCALRSFVAVGTR